MTRISPLMTPAPVAIGAGTSVEEASRLMASLGLRHLPVVDDDGRLVGMVSDRDLRGPLVGDGGARPVPAPGDPVGGLMARDVVTALPGEELGVVARRIIDRRIGAVPVVDEGGGLQGIVSYVDVLRRLADDADADARAVERMDG